MAQVGKRTQSAAQIAQLLVLSERQVYELARKGVLPRDGRGKYNLGECLRAYILHMREVASGRQGDGKLSLADERARLARLQADHQALKNDELRGALVKADEVERASVAIHSNVQRRLLGVPSKAAPLVAEERDALACETIIREFIESALQAIADTEVTETSDQDDPP